MTKMLKQKFSEILTIFNFGRSATLRWPYCRALELPFRSDPACFVLYFAGGHHILGDGRLQLRQVGKFHLST